MSNPVSPPLHAPSTNPPAPGNCPNCNSTLFGEVDNHRVAPRDQAQIGNHVSKCQECGFELTQAIHGRDRNPHPHTSGPPTFLW